MPTTHRRGPDTGPTFYAPLRTRRRIPSNQSAAGNVEKVDQIYGWNPRIEPDIWWEFAGGASGYLQGTNGLMVARTTGTPTGVAQVANSANGEVSMTLANTNEVEFAGVDWADELNIPATAQPFFEAFVKTPALALTSVQDVIIGLQTAYNSTLGSVSKYIRFRLNGSNVVLIEGKDGTTTNNLTTPASSITLSAATYYLFTIFQEANGDYGFYIDDNQIGTLTQKDFASTDLLQPIVGIRKASGTGVPALTMDMLRVAWSRF